MGAPATSVYFCRDIPLKPTYEHTYYFAMADAQRAFFDSRIGAVRSQYTFARKQWPLRVDMGFEEARLYNYVFFQNGTGKLYYYFVTDHVYINDATTEFQLEIDVMQTYMFDFRLQKCFVEREHVNDDTIGKHVLDEGLDVGELTVQDDDTIPLSDMCVLVQSSVQLTGEIGARASSGWYGKVYSGLAIYVARGQTGIAHLQSALNQLDTLGKSDGVISMWMYPARLVRVQVDGAATTALNINALLPAYDPWTDSVTGALPTSIGGYVPKNNKMYCYPYSFAYVSNNEGTGAVYRYERFSARSITFQIEGSVLPDGGVRLIPVNYDGVNRNNEEGLSLGAFPSCAWNQDVYKIWLAQNSATRSVALDRATVAAATSGASALVSALTLDFSGAASAAQAGVNAGFDIAAIMAQGDDKAVQPPQAKGQQGASINIDTGFKSFTLYHKCCDYDHAQAIDEFFSAYGYRVNSFKVPNLTGRESWNHVKTVGCIISGDIPAADSTKIEAIFNKGVTFWHGDFIGDYSRSNSIV